MDSWSIVLGERPMHGGWATEAMVGPHVSHSFVCVQDNQHRNVMQVHGVYSDRSPVRAVLNSVANVATGHQFHISSLDVVVLTTPHLMEAFAAHSTITYTQEVTGSPEEIMRAAACLVDVAAQIKEAGLDYFFNVLAHTTQDCHSVSAEELRRIQLDFKAAALIFRTPGSETNLEKIYPALAKINVDKTSPFCKVMEHMRETLPLVSPDWKSAQQDILGHYISCHCPHIETDLIEARVAAIA